MTASAMTVLMFSTALLTPLPPKRLLSPSRYRAVGQRDLGLYSGVAAGVQDLTAQNVYDLKIVHTLYLHI